MGKAKKKRQDFQKVKLKVGKKLPRADNATDTTFKSRSIQIKEQLRTSSELPTTKRKLNINDLLSQLQHYSASVKHDALTGLKELLASNPQLFNQYLAVLVDRLAHLFVDKDAVVRNTVVKILKDVMPNITANQMSPFFPILCAHLCCAMTHIQDEIQIDSLAILDLVLDHYPHLVIQNSAQLLPNFIAQISKQTTKKQSRTAFSLAVNPNSKLTNQKGRTKIMERLHKFLKAYAYALKTKRNSADVVVETVSIKWSLDEGIYHQPMARQPEGQGFILRPSQSNTDSSQSGKLESFVESIVPLLIECWIEACPSSGERRQSTGHVVNSESAALMSSVLGILQTLWECVELDQQGNIDWLCDRYLDTFLLHFMTGFPYSVHRSATVAKGQKSKSIQVSPLTINLNLCKIMTYFLKEQQASAQWSVAIVTYVTEILIGGDVTMEQRRMLFQIAKKLLKSFSGDRDLVSTLFTSVYQAYKNSHTTSECHMTLLFLEELIANHQMCSQIEGSCSFDDWLCSLPANMCPQATDVKDKDKDISVKVLNILQLVLKRGRCSQPCLEALRDAVQNVLDPAMKPGISCYSFQQTMRLVELLYWFPVIDSSLYHTLCQFCGNPSVSIETVRYLLIVLHQRYLRHQQRNRNRMLTDTMLKEDQNYISFLLSVLLGCKQDDLILQGSDVKFPSEETQSMQRQGCLTQVILSLCQQFPSTDQLWKILDQALGKLLAAYQIPRFSSAISIIQTFVSLCPSSSTASQLANQLIPLVNKVTLFVLSSENGIDKEIAEGVWKLIGIAFNKFNHVVDGYFDHLIHILQGKDLDSNILERTTLVLTKLLQQDGVRATFTREKQKLLSVQEILKQRIHTDSQCWADFCYSVSVL